MQLKTPEADAGLTSPPSSSTGQNLIDMKDQIKLEHDTLRKEIEAAKVWEVRLLVGGLIGFPAAFEFARKTDENSDWYLVVYFLPLGVLVLSFLVAFVRWSAMRCGQYIREELEPHFPLVGWESWLGKKKIRRTSEVLLAIAFAVLVAIYYMVAAWIGFIRIKAQYGGLISGTVAFVYMLGLLVTIVFAWTPTRNDQATLDSTWLLLFASFIGRAAAQLRKRCVGWAKRSMPTKLRAR